MVTRTLKRALVSPPVVGAAMMLALSLRALAAEDVGAEELGTRARADAVNHFILTRYAAEIRSVGIAIAAVAVATGVVIGLVATLVLGLKPRRSRTLRGQLVESALVVSVLAGALELWGMARAPQLYAATFYARGGVWRTVQVVATDTLGPGGVVLLAGLVLCLYTRGLGWARVRVARVRWLAPWTLASGAALGVPGGGAPVISEGRAAPAGAAPLVDARRPNILILAADSLRADRIDTRRAPHLSALADRSVLFERAYVSLPRTFSSWVTILTGRHAHHHGIRSMFPRWEERAKDFDALPKRLRDAGYETAVVSDYAGDIFGRIELGFGAVDTPGFDFRELIRQRALERETPLLPWLHSRPGRKIFPVLRELPNAADPRYLAEDAKAWISSLASQKRPFFLTVFFSTAHFPYAAPAPYYRMFTDPAYRGRYKYHKPVSLGRDAGAEAPDEEDVRQIRGLYDGAVASIDDAIDDVLHHLESKDLARNTVVVVTADHGEHLYENGRGQGHGDHLFGDEGTHVPLIVHDPRGVAPRRERAIVRDVDIAPTLYELADLPAPKDVDGVSLVGAMNGRPAPRLHAFAESELWFTEDIPGLSRDLRMPYPGIMGLSEIDAAHGDEIVMRRSMIPITTMARHRMVKDDRYKLVYVPTRKGAYVLLFDTETDRDELRDVSPSHPKEVARLRGELFGWMMKDPSIEMVNGYAVPREAP